MSSKNKELTNYLKNIGYITSWDKIKDEYFNPELQKDISKKVLKLHIKGANDLAI